MLWSNVLLESATTVVASGSATGYAATNLQNTKRTLKWRSTTTTGNQTVTISFSARTVNAVAIGDWLLHTSGGTVKAEYKNGGGAYANFGGGTGLFTIPSPARTGLSVLYSTGGVTATDIKLTFTNTGGVNTYVELGLVFVADSAGYFTATVNVTDDLGYELVDPSEERTSVGGQKEFNAKPGYIVVPTEFGWIGASQKDSLLAIRDSVGRRIPVIVAVDPDDLNKTVYGRLADVRLRASHQTRDQWSVRMSVEEAR